MPVFRAAANEPTANEPTANRPAGNAGTYPANRPGRPADPTPPQGRAHPRTVAPPRPAGPAQPWTPPQQRAPAAARRDGESPPYSEGPTEPLRAAEAHAPDRRAPRRRRRLAVVIAVLLSLLALIGSAVAGFFAWRAMEVARAAQTQPAAVVPTVPPARAPEPEEYPVTYAKEPLRVQVGCSAVLFLDLDEPRADAQEQHADLRYDSRCGDEPARISLGAGATAGSQSTGADLDAAGCRRAIRTSPLGPGADVEVKPGTALCVLTAGDPAELVLVEITDVGGTGTAGLRATSWRVPR